jgi:hypothetical protein
MISLLINVNIEKESVLALVVDTDEAKHLQLRITPNQQDLGLTAQYNGEAYHTIHEVLESSILRNGANDNPQEACRPAPVAQPPTPRHRTSLFR